MTTPDDGLVRCDWAVGKPGSADFELYRDYHDKEWGQPLRGQVPLFERMSLEAFQSGLSWLIILRKRENFRQAFAGFDPAKVARFTDADVARLMADEGIVRNRAKIVATIANARVVADGPGDLSELLWSFAPARRRTSCDLGRRPRHDAGIHRYGTRIEASWVPFRRPHDRVRTDAGDRDGRRSPAGVLGSFHCRMKRRAGGHVHLAALIGNNGVVNVQLTGQLESGGSARWRR